MNEENMEICPQCNEPFNPWASKSKGQKHPYKRCFNCKAQDIPKESYGEQAPDPGSPAPPEVTSTGLDARLDSMGTFIQDEFRKIQVTLDEIKEDLTNRP